MATSQIKFRAIVDKLKRQLVKDGRNIACYSEFYNIELNTEKIRYVEELVRSYERPLKLHYCPKLKSEKSEEKCIAHRKKGNSLYKQRKFEEALIEFNKSICWAVKGSGGDAIGYSNRSAVLFEMNKWTECLENIRLARETGNLPSSVLDKLKRREEMCSQQVQSCEHESQSTENDGSQDVHIDSLELIEEDEPVLVTTNKFFRKGDVVAIEKPFAILLDESETYNYCHNCLERSALYTSIPCLECSSAIFCNLKCMEEAFDRFHKYECPIIDFLCEALDHDARSALRMFLVAVHAYGNTEGLIALSENPSDLVKTYLEIKWTEYSAKDHYEAIYKSKLPQLSGFGIVTTVVLIRDYLMLKYTSLKEIIVSEAEKDMFGNLLLQNFISVISDPVNLKQCDGREFGITVTAFGRLLMPSRFPNVEPYWENGYIIYKASRYIPTNSLLFKELMEFTNVANYEFHKLWTRLVLTFVPGNFMLN